MVADGCASVPLGTSLLSAAPTPPLLDTPALFCFALASIYKGIILYKAIYKHETNFVDSLIASIV
jgi:hypothetical protein